MKWLIRPAISEPLIHTITTGTTSNYHRDNGRYLHHQELTTSPAYDTSTKPQRKLIGYEETIPTVPQLETKIPRCSA